MYKHQILTVNLDGGWCSLVQVSPGVPGSLKFFTFTSLDYLLLFTMHLLCLKNPVKNPPDSSYASAGWKSWVSQVLSG